MASTMSADAFTTSNAFTTSDYRDVYPAIQPTQSSLRKAGKVVIITGASRGICRDSLAWVFATAGTRAIIITTRKVESLKETEALIKKINSAIEIFSVALETTNEESVSSAFASVKAEYGHIDILVNNAGVYDSNGINLSSTDDSQTATWWREFEANVRCTMLMTKHFFALTGPTNPATLIYLSSGAGLAIMPSASVYGITKLADLQLAAFASAANSNVTAIAFHTGIVFTDMVAGVEFFHHFAKGTPQLARSMVNWLASEQAPFLSGRYVSANWDVEEILERKEEIVEKNLLNVCLTGLKWRNAEVKG